GYHTAGAIRVPPNVSLILLPAYAPELNPVENLWHYLRSHHWANRVYGGYDELRDEAVRSLCRVCLDAERMKTDCAADYIALGPGNSRTPYYRAGSGSGPHTRRLL